MGLRGVMGRGLMWEAWCLYTSPSGLSLPGSTLTYRGLGMELTIPGPYYPYSLLSHLAPMLWFISCSYRVYLGREPENRAVQGYRSINRNVDGEGNVESLQVAVTLVVPLNTPDCYSLVEVAASVLMCTRTLTCNFRVYTRGVSLQRNA